jgi:O-antigen/teichoic acid export membrane protein
MKAAKDLVITLIGYGSIPLVGFITGTLAARMLGPSGRGELAAILTIPTLLSIVAALGTTQSMTYYSARRPKQSGEILGSALFLTVIACLPVCILGAVLQILTLDSFSRSVQQTAFIFLLFIPLSIVNAAPWSIFQGHQRFLTFNFLRLLPQLVYLGIMIVAYCMGKTKAEWIALSYLASSAVICLIATWLFYRSLIKQALRVNFSLLREIIPYGLYSFMNYLPHSLNQRIDLIFIAAWLSAHKLGLYAVGASLSTLCLPISMAIGATIFPKLASAPVGSAHKVFSSTIRWTLIAVVLMTTALILCTPLIVPLLFGNQFKEAIPPSMLLVFAGGFLALNMIFADGYRGLGHPKIPMIAELSGLIITVIGLIILLPAFGIWGAATVSICSYCTSFAILAAFFLKDISEPLSSWPAAYLREARTGFTRLKLTKAASCLITQPH